MNRLHKLGLGAFAGLMTASPSWAAGSTLPNPTDAWNHTWTEVLIDLWVIGIIFGIAALYMLYKYRAKDPDDIGHAPKLSRAQGWAWILVPAALFLADDFLLSAKGWSLWNIQRSVPAGSMEIKVTGTQWNFEYDYGDGVTVNSTDLDKPQPGDEEYSAQKITEILANEKILDGDLVVPVGQPIVFRMTSTDVIHSFGITDYRLKEDMMPGRITYLWFVAKEPATSQVLCVEFCGDSHSGMYSRLRAIPKAEFEAWLAKKKSEAALEKSVTKLAAN